MTGGSARDDLLTSIWSVVGAFSLASSVRGTTATTAPTSLP